MNNDFPNYDTTQDELLRQVRHLNFIQTLIAEHQLDIEKTQAKILNLLNHTKKGQETYKVDIFDVVIRTGLIRSLDKKRYEWYKDLFEPQFNPVKVKMKKTYEVDPQIAEMINEIGSIHDRNMYKEVITEKDAKLSMKISISKA